MNFMFDANACIYLLTNAYSSLTERVGQQEAGSMCISSIAFAEVAMGSARGKPPDMAVLDAFLQQVPLVEFDDAAARAYALLPFRRGSFDRLIAAHALSLGLTVLTTNIADFADVPGLKVENWTLA